MSLDGVEKYMGIEQSFFGETVDRRPAYLYRLANNNGMSAAITDYGGAVVSLMVPDRSGRPDDVVLGCDSPEGYFSCPYFGAIIGRHSNRIEDASFELNGIKYDLARNDGRNHLHGGITGFDKVLWEAETVYNKGVEALKLTYRSRDGEENYPGNLEVTVIYTVTEDDSLKIEYHAISDRDTVVNLTNHSYFNLSGHSSGDIKNHKLKLNSHRFTVINGECIPTGEIRDVEGTPMDFTELKPISSGLESDYEQILLGKGYDHNWVLDVSGKEPEIAAELIDDATGRRMEVFTTKPGIQFYTGNFLDGSVKGKNGAQYGKWSGLCLETQYFPNAMKHKHFPSPVLKAGQEYKHTTIYKFSMIK